MSISISGLVLAATILLINLSIGAVVIARNPRNSLNRWFFILSASVALWAASSLISDTTQSYQISRYTSFAAYGFSFFAVVSSYMFSKVFAKNTLSSLDKRLLLPIFIILSILFSTKLVYNLTSFDEYELGILYTPYLIGVSILIILSVINFRYAIKHGDRIKVNQAKFIMTGIILTILLSLITNAIVPAIMETTATTKIGPLFSMVFVGSIAYAIVKHRLFDIRLIVARSFAYVLTLGLLFIVYSIFSSFALNTILGESNTSPTITALNAVALALSVLAYQPIKRFFDRLTNKIFYRDAYDPQAFLDELNKSVVSNIEIGVLLRQTSKVIEKHLKCSFCVVEIQKVGDNPPRMIGSDGFKINNEDTLTIRDFVNELEENLIIADDLGEKNSQLKKALSKNNISLVVNMKTSAYSEETSLAHLMIGTKKSGNVYNKQDLRIIEIIADELVIAIQNALRFEEIQGFAVTLQQEVNQATDKLQRTNKKLRDMDETKDEFISMASHQLRTPLTSVKGYMSMVLEGDAGKLNKQQTELLNQAFVSSQRMVYLIADLLNVSRLKTGKFIIEAAPTNLANVVEGEIAQLKEVAKGKKHELIYKKPKDFPKLMLDETKIRQVIMNFADNAIYYTPTGGKIEIGLKEDKNNVYFTVKDSGLGVPQSEQKHMFTKFYRAKNARKARPDGTGLGLFMAQKVINAQGGNIIFESVEGKGSTFGFTFDKTKLSVNN